MFFISIYIYTTNAKNIEKMPTIKPKRQKGKQEKSRHEKREKKVTKKREPTADSVPLYIITAVYVSITH